MWNALGGGGAAVSTGRTPPPPGAYADSHAGKTSGDLNSYVIRTNHGGGGRERERKRKREGRGRSERSTVVCGGG